MSDTSTRRPAPRAAQKQRGRAAPQRRNRMWLWTIIGVAILAVPVIIFAVAFNQSGGPVGEIEGVQTFQNVSAGHQEGELTYEQTPPAGGTHNGVWQNCGTYNLPVANENAVHSLEHGAVWITYRSDLPADQVDQLKQLVRGRPYTLLSPYPDLPSPVVASVWGLQLKVDQASDPRLPQFISKYVQGPQTPEPGATCSGGQPAPAGQP